MVNLMIMLLPVGCGCGTWFRFVRRRCQKSARIKSAIVTQKIRTQDFICIFYQKIVDINFYHCYRRLGYISNNHTFERIVVLSMIFPGEMKMAKSGKNATYCNYSQVL